jgi:hypothetical protein
MGYDLHITRAEDWTDSKNFPIHPREWLQIIEKDNELKISDTNGKYFAIWYKHLTDKESWFDLTDGEVYTKNPDDFSIRKMIEIAEKLNAKVQGDDSEVYVIKNGEIYYTDDGIEFTKFQNVNLESVEATKSWWQIIFGFLNRR